MNREFYTRKHIVRWLPRAAPSRWQFRRYPNNGPAWRGYVVGPVAIAIFPRRDR